MLNCAHAMFLSEDDLAGEQPEILHEITMKHLMRSGQLDLQDFLDRADMLGALGRTVLISNYGEYYRLIQYLRRYTDRSIGLPLGVPTLHEIFDEKYYSNLDGGILEGLGRLFKKGCASMSTRLRTKRASFWRPLPTAWNRACRPCTPICWRTASSCR